MDANSAQNMQIMADLEIEMMTDLFNKLTSACQKKCISSKYKEGELTKGESVCLDRCVAKYLDIHERIGKKLTAMSAQDEQLMTQMQSR